MICSCAFVVTGQEICPRPPAGSLVQSPSELSSSASGTLEVTLNFRSEQDTFSQTRYCYVTPDGAQSPTLRVKPGDTVVLHLKNEVKATSADPLRMSQNCAASAMTADATNLHFHGLSIPPVCHQDEVLRTLVEPREEFEYRFSIPEDQPPGLYWYHPHPHGFTEGQVLGGASGAMIVTGIEHFRPEILGLKQRVLVFRDQLQPGQQLNYMEPGEESEKDVSLNFVPVIAPLFTPARIEMVAGGQEFWRVLNAAADTYFHLQLPLDLIALDGAPLRRLIHRSDILIPPGGRAEFIVTAPQTGRTAQLISKSYDTGPLGEKTPARVLATLTAHDWPQAGLSSGVFSLLTGGVEDLSALKPARVRRIYLSEDRQDLEDPTLLARYFITEEGATPKAFDMMAEEPDITAEQGTVEDWVIENRAREVHTFHIHQLHFQVLERDGKKLAEPLTMDTIDLPYWDGKSPTYPNVKLRMDFRSPAIVGTFVYHCHILEHEDNGMMGRIRVVHGK